MDSKSEVHCPFSVSILGSGEWGNYCASPFPLPFYSQPLLLEKGQGVSILSQIFSPLG